MRAKILWFSPQILVEMFKPASYCEDRVRCVTPLPEDARLHTATISVDRAYYPERVGFIVISESFEEVDEDGGLIPEMRLLFEKVRP